MENAVDHITEELFKIIKGNGHTVVLFTDEGQKTIDPAEARRIWIDDLKIMVNFINDSNSREIVVNLGKETDIQSIKPMLDSIRTLANRYIVEYTVKTFGKTIGPKDFAYQAKNVTEDNDMDINEGFSGWSGSARKSTQTLEDARIIVRHKRSVDETKRGARTRQIESIFIENAAGERFKFPSNNLTAARAMTRHIKEGGTPYDDFGQHIYETMDELNELKKFQRHNKRNDFFEDANITEEIGNRVTSLRTSLRQISGVKGYPTHFESFTNEQADVSPEQLDELKDNVTTHSFDEAISSSLPYVARVIESYKTRQVNEGAIVEFARNVMKNESFAVNKLMDNNDPDCPYNRKFKNTVAEVAEWISHIAPTLTDSTLASQMTQIGETISQVGPQHVGMVEAAIKVIRQNASVAESTHGENISIDEAELAQITETLDKYSVRKLFGV